MILKTDISPLCSWAELEIQTIREGESFPAFLVPIIWLLWEEAEMCLWKTSSKGMP
jgi:hypothetical protein